MGELWSDLGQVERETLATAVDDAARLGELIQERGALIRSIGQRLSELPAAEQPECYDRLLGHYAAGQALGDRLRQERGRAVEAWGESAHEQQVLRLLEGTRSEQSRGEPGARLVEELG